jgi:hypothetical protein
MLADTKTNLAIAKDKRLKFDDEERKHHTEKTKFEKEKAKIELKVYKISQLKQIREKNPEFTEEQILELFPDFKDIIHIVK